MSKMNIDFLCSASQKEKRPLDSDLKIQDLSHLSSGQLDDQHKPQFGKPENNQRMMLKSPENTPIVIDSGLDGVILERHSKFQNNVPFQGAIDPNDRSFPQEDCQRRFYDLTQSENPNKDRILQNLAGSENAQKSLSLDEEKAEGKDIDFEILNVVQGSHHQDRNQSQ
eukprot:TRINITY_DN5492_c0_g1_i1.p1 TRINITY_DN5492_c0_g1~~TRINITY_DN5492_c0_g1_i1.p1  ORF type:complete len:168 (+),score=36.88 TRINITY_DN5492_c0_g1_i1:171-674(+)